MKFPDFLNKKTREMRNQQKPLKFAFIKLHMNFRIIWLHIDKIKIIENDWKNFCSTVDNIY